MDKHQINIAIWLGFEHFTPMRREGIARYVYFLSTFLLKHKNVSVEVWCYNTNYSELYSLFTPILETPESKDRLHIHTEQPRGTGKIVSSGKIENYISDFESYFKSAQPKENIEKVFKTYFFMRLQNYAVKAFKHLAISQPTLMLLVAYLFFEAFGIDSIFGINIPLLMLAGGLFLGVALIYKNFLHHKRKGNKSLPSVFNNQSKSDIVLIPYVGLNNAAALNKPTLLAIHDLITFPFLSSFIQSGVPFWQLMDGNYRIFNFLKKLDEKKSHFVTNSSYTIDYQLKPLKLNFDSERFKTIHLPVNPRSYNQNKVNVVEKYKLNTPYVFFPSQVRPYKNFEVILLALKKLQDENVNIGGVFTCKNFEDNYPLHQLLLNLNLKNISFLSDVSESELYDLHEQASISVAPSLFEGGLPWQALEGLSTNTPVALANIEMSKRRLKDSNLDPNSLKFFEPDDHIKLSELIIYALNHRQDYVSSQRHATETLLSYNWQNCADQYLLLIKNILKIK